MGKDILRTVLGSDFGSGRAGGNLMTGAEPMSLGEQRARDELYDRFQLKGGLVRG